MKLMNMPPTKKTRRRPKNPMRKASKISLRLYYGNEIALGPGKADLLEAIKKTGSIAAASRSMDMSYKRAWSLVETMNACFRAPLVETVKGGAARGGADLTPLGEETLRRYRKMQSSANAALRRDMAKLKSLLAE